MEVGNAKTGVRSQVLQLHTYKITLIQQDNRIDL